MKRKLLYLLFFIYFFQISIAQNVTLDTSFGVGGKVVNSSITSGQAIQLQSDGKIVSCYLSDFSVFGNMHLTRFNIDGSIDTTFGNNGFVNSTLVNETGGINMMKIQSDDKIIITGSLLVGSSFDFSTVQYNSNGTIDASFGINGYAITDFQGAGFSSVVEIQNDGKILIGGNVYNNSNDFAIVRYLANGLIDNSFATNGKFTYNFGIHTIPNSGQYSSEYMHSIKINSNGKIFLGGNTNVNESLSGHSNFGVICLNQDGIFETGFGENGQKVISFGAEAILQNMKFNNDDKLVLCGYNYTIVTVNFSSQPKIALVKLNSNGDFDDSFGVNGKVLVNRSNTNNTDLVSDFIFDENSKILCVGSSANDAFTNLDIMLIRFDENGLIDSSFNENGYSLIDFNNTNDYGYSILMQSDGKYVCAGAIDYSIGCLARYELTNLSTSQFSKSKFSVSPNPFTTSINLTFSLTKNEILTIDLVDANGRIIQNLSEEKAFSSGNNSLNLDLPETLSKGIYFLKINDGFENNTIKIIK